MKQYLLLVGLLLLIGFTANAQLDSTKVVDNKGTIKYVLNATNSKIITQKDSLTLYVTPKQLSNLENEIGTDYVKFADTSSMLAAYLNSVGNGLTKNGKSLALGGTLSTNATIVTSESNFMQIRGLTSGSTSADSVMVVDPSNATPKWNSASKLFNALTFDNGLTKTGNTVRLGGNPANPVIGERSFGADPARVSRLAAAWMRGSLREVVACCVKHFPGHGDTHVDSHHALPMVGKSMAELEALELLPFRMLLSGPDPAPAVMTAHIVYPRIDANHPATLSRPLLTTVLREAMKYDGVVITEALFMKAVHERWGHARAAVMALQAGADMPLAQGSKHEQSLAVQAIKAALREGDLLPAQVLRAQAGLQAFREAFTNADPQLMEPVQELEVRVPADLMGDVMTDLQTRRSIVMGVDSSGRYQIIKAHTPLAELDRYSTTLRSLTQGRGTYTERFLAYQPVPIEL